MAPGFDRPWLAEQNPHLLLQSTAERAHRNHEAVEELERNVRDAQIDVTRLARGIQDDQTLMTELQNDMKNVMGRMWERHVQMEEKKFRMMELQGQVWALKLETSNVVSQVKNLQHRPRSQRKSPRQTDGTKTSKFLPPSEKSHKYNVKAKSGKHPITEIDMYLYIPGSKQQSRQGRRCKILETTSKNRRVSRLKESFRNLIHATQRNRDLYASMSDPRNQHIYATQEEGKMRCIAQVLSGDGGVCQFEHGNTEYACDDCVKHNRPCIRMETHMIGTMLVFYPRP